MKVSIPKLRSGRPKYASDGSARSHMREAVIGLLDQKVGKVIGYALVAIHEPAAGKPHNYGYIATCHCSDTMHHHSDIPEIVKNKLSPETYLQGAAK
jgi:hypothetical protein